jgi:pimeloyl-ACP methyl ester carboxylesterase
MTVLDVKGEPHERSFDQPAHPRRPRLGLGAPNLPQGFTDTFTSRYVDTGELRLHAVIGGDGPPLLLVHGWPQTWYAWRMLMPTLARDFQVIAVDQRGIGLSDKPQDGYDTGTFAGDMVAPMDALGHQRFAVYGTDTGMPIAYAVAADHRDRLDRLVVSEAPLPGVSPSPPRPGPTSSPTTPSATTSTASPPTPMPCAAASSSTARSPPSSPRTSGARPGG